MNGKGDAQRPSSIPAEELAANWKRIFGKPLKKIVNKKGK
jgi:hypothetical protein|tara:strand:+ start:601 stop:720 length:120 start_codon:yes stop_codon:yes gene_type:complete